MNNKRGTTSIFLVFILTAMIALTAVFIYAAKRAAIFSYCDGVLNLSGKSILSEFNLELKSMYGLFAFENSGILIKQDLTDYISYALSRNEDAEVGNIRIDMGNYSLGNTQVLKKQILEYMKFAMENKLFEQKGKKESPGVPEAEGKKKSRTLRNKKIIDTLPSAALTGSQPVFSQWAGDVSSHLDSLSEIFRESSETYLMDRYIVETFKHALSSKKGTSTFFEHEAEYILEGNYSDKKNRAGIRKGIVIMRSGLNAAYLYLDSKKRNAVLAAAELLTPGPAAAVTQAVLIGTWALAEAENDAKLLLRGKPVPLFKSEASWATDLDTVLKGSMSSTKGCIDTRCKDGLLYQDYLMIFLHIQSETVKLSRVMDLIQINMKGNYSRDFLLRWCSCGFQLKAEINGRERAYDFKY